MRDWGDVDYGVDCLLVIVAYMFKTLANSRLLDFSQRDSPRSRCLLTAFWAVLGKVESDMAYEVVVTLLDYPFTHGGRASLMMD